MGCKAKIKKIADTRHASAIFYSRTGKSYLQVHVEQFVPRKPLLAQLGEERIGIELLDVEHPGAAPEALGPHRSAQSRRNARGERHGLRAGLLESLLVVAVVINIVGALLAVLQALDAAADRGLSVVVGAQRLGIGKNRLEELDRDDLDAVVDDRVDTRHADVLDDAQVREVFLAEGHPETCTLNGRIVLNQRLELLVVDHIRLALADTRVIERTVYLMRLGGNPLAVLEITPFLRHLADVDLGIEVRGESHAVVARVAIHDVEVVDLVEMVLGGIGREDGRHARVEAAAEDRREARSLEAVLIGPLPRVFEMCLVLRLVVGCVEVVAAAFEAGVHDRKVLVRKRHVDHDVGFERAEQFAQLRHAVCVDLGGLHAVAADGGRNGVAFGFGTGVCFFGQATAWL